MNNQQPFTDAQRDEWVRQQYQTATKYLADKGMVTASVADKDSRYIDPLVAVWSLKLLDNSRVWVICGNLPTDHVNSEVADNARDALRHFSMKWQMQAENILQNDPDQSQKGYAELLIGRAEGIYVLHNDKKLWEQAMV